MRPQLLMVPRRPLRVVHPLKAGPPLKARPPQPTTGIALPFQTKRTMMMPVTLRKLRPLRRKQNPRLSESSRMKWTLMLGIMGMELPQ